jgi:cation:H+ antiporter
MNIFIAITILALSIVMICMSSDVIVDNAILIATSIGISEKIITMTAIVIGTSLPELMLTVTSAKKGEFDMTVGNIIGTNIFNVCVVLGLPIAIFGDIMLENFALVDIFVVFLSSLCLFVFARSERTISKKEGLIMLLIFASYYAYLFI